MLTLWPEAGDTKPEAADYEDQTIGHAHPREKLHTHPCPCYPRRQRWQQAVVTVAVAAQGYVCSANISKPGKAKNVFPTAAAELDSWAGAEAPQQGWHKTCLEQGATSRRARE